MDSTLATFQHTKLQFKGNYIQSMVVLSVLTFGRLK